MTKPQFMSFYKGTPYEIGAGTAYDAIFAALSEAGILTPLTIVGALATVRVEVGRSFLPITEDTDGSSYESRIDLGNYVPGDGYTYRGRGYIQLTGRKNYTNYGKALGLDLICHPELALEVPTSAKILARYFKDHGCSDACEKKDWTTVRHLVNGGSNGLSEFLQVVSKYLSASN